ncbi:MAG: ATP-binding cassette domain-containing protein [Proteobacteria bacterium]|nr:ATP-binding cassette domain-containing protein [Pseudomonadota bacterium]MCL2309137.1 ATP-binding cassette domain-containing protein [Pseudomonadota bacterium]
MIRLDHLTLARGAQILLDDVSLMIHDHHKVGIIGANGCGKTSLFALLRGVLSPERGNVLLPKRAVIAHVAQETPNVATSALDYVLDGDRELRTVEAAIAHLQGSAFDNHHDSQKEGLALAEWHHRFEAIDGYRARARAGELLAGLGFSHAQHHDPVNMFSGGWRMRLNLAQALMCRSDILLLDEPTNHLDLDAVLWLEDWLRRYPGTLLLITHDRDFLDSIVDTIVHFDQRTLKTYSGNYALFEQERAAALANQQATFEKQQRTIAHLQSFVDRFRAKATKAKQAQSRLRQLEKMTRISAAHVDSPFSFSFPLSDSRTRQLLRLENADLGYRADAPVLPNIECGILSDSRLGLLGPNGAGKSTLIKSMTGRLPLLHGSRHTARDLRIGYFAQHQLDTLDSQASALLHLQRLDPDAREQTLRDFLGGFAFHGEQATQTIASFSGGERARLALALIVYMRPQLLILDEPTNHLDIDMREALTEALQAYNGALIVVAHDRHLLSATVDEFWLVHQGAVAPFDGDLDDYRRFVLDHLRHEASDGASNNDAISASATAPPTNNLVPDRKTQKRLDAEARQRRAPLVKRQNEIEKILEKLSAERASLEHWLASPEAYLDNAKARLTEALVRQREIAREIETMEVEWLELAEVASREAKTDS